MPVLKTLVDADIKNCFRNAAMAANKTESELLREAVISKIESESGKALPARLDAEEGQLSEMSVLKTRVEAYIKILFRRAAEAVRKTESELLREIVIDRISLPGADDQPVKPDPAKLGVTLMTIRMPGFVAEAITKRSKSIGMSSSRWVAALAQSHLTRVPVASEEEIKALRISNRELAAIGRNINQIARALNNPLQDSEPFPVQRLIQLSEVILTNRVSIEALIRASQNAWDIS